MVNSDAKTKHIKDHMDNDEDLIYWNSAFRRAYFPSEFGQEKQFLRYIDKE